MKKLLILPFIAFLLVACGDEDATTATTAAAGGDSELMRLTEENRQLRSAQLERDSLDMDYHSTLMEIETNLASIYQKEAKIAISTQKLDGVELSGDAKDRIAAEINAINDLMAKNRQKIASLNKKLKAARGNVSSLEERLAAMEAMVTSKDEEIMGLRDELAMMNIEMELLYLENEDLVRQLDLQIEEINTAWYAIGTKNELIENKVITKEGGFIGIGKTEKMRDDFNDAYFTRIDVTDQKEILLGGKKARLVTSHPTTSYKMVGENPVQKIQITNQVEFWKASKYCVIIME